MGDYNNPNDNNNQPNNWNSNQQNGQPDNQQPYGQPNLQQPQQEQPQNGQNYPQYNQNPNGYQQYNQNPYQNNQYQYQQYQAPVQNQSNGMAVGSLICGILGILLSCCLWYIAIPLAIAGLVLGILVIKNKKGGKNLAIVGIILSSISIIMGIIIAIMMIAVFTNPEFSSMYQQILQEIETTY